MLRLLLLATFVAMAASKNSYLVVSPTQIRPGVRLNISVSILKAPSDVTVVGALINKANDQIVTTASGTFSQGVPGTLSIQVPDTLHSGSYKLKVQGSQGLTFRNETDLSYQSKSMSVFIQTDKAMYKPGQTVHFRAFAVYPNLTVYTGPMDISVYDASTNKIKQWSGLRDASGVVTNYMVMDTQPVLGDWKIKVSCHGRTAEKMVTIAHYVLPKFEVTVELPSYALSSDGSITGKVKAKYTYGKPVKGTVEIRAKIEHYYRPWNYHGAEPMVTQKMAIDGEASFSLPLAHIKQVQKYINGRSLVVEANVTESLNHIKRNGSSKVQFYQHAVKLEFLPSNPKTFKPGLPYTAYLRVAQQDDRPVVGMRKDVSLRSTATYELPAPSTTPAWYYPSTRTYTLPNHTFSVPDNGIVPIQVDIPDNATHMNLNAHYGEVQSTLSLSKSYSPSNSYIQLFLKSTTLRAGQIANMDIKSTSAFTRATYQILSRGTIVATGSITGDVSKLTSFSFPITDKMAPNARIVVFYVGSGGEVVTDSISFDVDGVFQNKVDIDFSASKVQPHDGVDVVVKADPQSVVNLLAVDQSVLLLKSGNDITDTEVIDELKTYDTIKPAHNFWGGGPVLFGRKKRMIWWPYPIYYGGSDAQAIFNNAGVKVLTDALVYHHKERMLPIRGPFFEFAGGVAPAMSLGPAPGGASGGAAVLKDVERVRSVFPETWLWSNTTTGVNGSVTIHTTVPDTITSWIASAFAVNRRSGLGVSPSTAKIEVFRPFFVSLNLPYSVVRGEQLALQANVFNYMSQDMDVVVTLENSTEFRNVMVDAHGVTKYVMQSATNTVRVPAGEAKSVFFPIVPAGLGKVDITVKAQSTLAADAVKRQLLIEAEGVPKEYNNPILIDLKNSSTFTATVPLSLPSGVVADSARATVTAIGDLMGPSVNGLDKLLKMPYGCGEQTMLGFAPDIFVTDYLSATNQLTGDIEEKALNYMEKGYQRELTFQHKDGSFSAFGDRDKSGSMWLSAFVVKSFHQAKQHIFIDDEVIKRAIDWMISKQNTDGSFPEPGRVIHKDMQGGSASGPALTAFVLISLMENNNLGGSIQTRINKASDLSKKYLELQLASMTDDYALAITSYALELARSSSAPISFKKLNADAIDKNGMTHWHKPDSGVTTTHHWRPPHQVGKPIDIEMTSYALLVHAHKQDFSGGLSIMKWITTQRNPSGGFVSTQDTVLALQALSGFARMAYSNSFNIHVDVTAGTFHTAFDINQKNALLLQTQKFPTIPSQVTITATGHGMALVEVAEFFNIEQEIEPPSFDITVTLARETLNLISVKTCTRWLQNGTSGMTVQEFGIPTGFEADLESIEGIGEIKKVETENRKVILYFDEIGTTPLCLTLDVVRTGMVAKSQPVAVRIYDYYQPSNQVTKFYQPTVLKNANICDVCKDCCP